MGIIVGAGPYHHPDGELYLTAHRHRHLLIEARCVSGEQIEHFLGVLARSNAQGISKNVTILRTVLRSVVVAICTWLIIIPQLPTIGHPQFALRPLPGCVGVFPFAIPTFEARVHQQVVGALGLILRQLGRDNYRTRHGEQKHNCT